MRYGGVGSQAGIFEAVMLLGIEQSEQERTETIPRIAWLRDIASQGLFALRVGQNHQRGGSQSLEWLIRTSSAGGSQSLELGVSITGIHTYRHRCRVGAGA